MSIRRIVMARRPKRKRYSAYQLLRRRGFSKRQAAALSGRLGPRRKRRKLRLYGYGPRKRRFERNPGLREGGSYYIHGSRIRRYPGIRSEADFLNRLSPYEREEYLSEQKEYGKMLGSINRQRKRISKRFRRWAKEDEIGLKVRRKYRFPATEYLESRRKKK